MVTFLFYLPFLLLFVLLAVYGERKISAFIQSRYGPVEVGPYGLLQTLADLLKMLQKEDIVPGAADKWLFLTGPVLVFVAVFTGFSVLPLTDQVAGAGMEAGLFFLLAFVSLDVVGILMSGWGSNNKFSMYGTMRSIAQVVSYEIPLGLSVLCVVMTAQSMDLQEISRQQGVFSANPNFLFGIRSWGIDLTDVGGFLTWNVVRNPFLIPVFVVFFIAGLAEANRAPFDLPESESEIVGGYHTEYSGFRWGIFMLSEYGMMLLVSLLGALLFFGGWNSPLPNIGYIRLADWTSGTFWGVGWLLGKALMLIFIQMWVRWTYPRLRVDQLMGLSWKFLTPVSLVLVFICAIWRLWMI
ncbi:MAG: NADH-quinone oxidoreductase subunit H [Cyclobacteriaceae bacterium]|nr:NADH-quinone oxidoreductase subunit H [Cyclobacteriaceae bacterium]